MDEIYQFKCLTDLREYITKHDFKARPIKPGNHPVLYPEDVLDVNENVRGIRLIDYEFSNDKQWILPHDQKGLSFAGTCYRLSRSYKLFNRGNKASPDYTGFYPTQTYRQASNSKLTDQKNPVQKVTSF